MRSSGGSKQIYQRRNRAKTLRNRSLIVGGVLSVLALIAIGGSFAFFTASGQAHNVVTTGGVKIRVVENRKDSAGNIVTYENPENVMPGDVISKIPQVENIDTEPAYVRMKIDAWAKLEDGSEFVLPDGLMAININDSAWKQKPDDYYYYTSALSESDMTAALFTEVRLSPNLSNLYQNATFSLRVSAQAVQVANNGNSALDAKGWPADSDIEAMLNGSRLAAMGSFEPKALLKEHEE